MRHSGRNHGQALLEAVFAIAIIIPSLLLLADLYLVIAGCRANEDVCSRAARAAAAGPPGDACRIVTSVLDFSNGQAEGALISNYKLAAPIEVKLDTQGQAWTAPEGTAASREDAVPSGGTVAITTEVEVRPFILHIFSGNRSLKLKSQQTCPVSYTGSINSEDLLR